MAQEVKGSGSVDVGGGVPGRDGEGRVGFEESGAGVLGGGSGGSSQEAR